jgi:hypothetical protein
LNFFPRGLIPRVLRLASASLSPDKCIEMTRKMQQFQGNGGKAIRLWSASRLAWNRRVREPG